MRSYTATYVMLRVKGANDVSDMLAYDANSASVIRLDNNSILYLREVNKYSLDLMCSSLV